MNEPHVMPTYARYPLTLVRGAGTRVWDETGRDYLDFAGALGVNALGHSHPAWVAAVRDQLDTLDMVSNLYATEPQAALADRLATLMPVADARVFFCNSGAEANEAAIKLARKHGLANGKPAIVALDGSFHGRTTATLAATGQPPKRAAFEPLVDWFRFVPPGDLDAIDAAITGDVGAVLLEPVMGEGGVRPLDEAYLRGVRALCDERVTLLVADEVQSGLGRCGEWAALQHAGVEADVLTLAKALGGGLPIGAMLARASISFEPGDHASTFGGGPIVCAGALAVIDAIERDGLLERARAIGEELPAAVAAAAPGAVVEARGRGCLWGFQLARPVANEVVVAMIAEGVLSSPAGPDVVRMSPPLIASDADVAEAARAFGAAVARVLEPEEVSP
ncbi:MAG TPA: acetylornithine/succinylornithine family transaminase [Actinomycetota bacterium]|nr:acetylornithine/succinylornithine family transaminase [Actinomycetota bacterium]